MTKMFWVRFRFLSSLFVTFRVLFSLLFYDQVYVFVTFLVLAVLEVLEVSGHNMFLERNEVYIFVTKMFWVRFRFFSSLCDVLNVFLSSFL